MKPSLDIITVTKDDLEGVAATILSTRKLRACSGVRQIIVDSSAEPVKRKVQEFLLGEKNIVYFSQEPAGIAHAFNLGIKSSHAEWLWFLNGRDESHPDLDAHFLMQLLLSSRAEVLICEIEYMQSKLRCKHPPLWKVWPPLYWIPHPATIIRRDLFYKYGFFNQELKIAMDGELWIRFFSKDIVIDMLSIPISIYDQNGVSSVEIAKVVQEVDRSIIKHFGLLLKLWFYRGLYLIGVLRRQFLTL